MRAWEFITEDEGRKRRPYLSRRLLNQNSPIVAWLVYPRATVGAASVSSTSKSASRPSSLPSES